MSLTIRPEKPEERSRLATIIARTYRGAGARTIEVAGKLRDLPQYVQDLSLVGEQDGEAVAFVMFTPVKVGARDSAALLMAPIAVDPQQENLDVEGFIQQALGKAKEKGYGYVLLHGDAEEYEKYGFKSAKEHGVQSELRLPGVELLVCQLDDKAEELAGKVDYPPFLA
tara:strand:+ start:656 stop:1162 length:507 start_codon:yes stop_codon:yes gene_type:complete